MISPDFVGYVGSSDFHDGKVFRVSVGDTTAEVLVKGHSGREYAVLFKGVGAVEMNAPEGMILYSLTEMRSSPPLRKFVFTNKDEGHPGSLTVLATDFSIRCFDWPEGIGEFEEFLRRKGLSFQRRGTVPYSGDKLCQYGTDKIAVRVIADRGDVWSAQIADIAGWPQEWYNATELRELIKGKEVDWHSVTEDMKIIEEDWHRIVDAFAPQNREETHTLLKSLRTERAKRRYGS